MTGEGEIMPRRASGTFRVDLAPIALHAEDPDGRLGRMSIAKTFSGDLEATSRGEMLSAMTAVKGSAGYVAIERVSGTLVGRVGSFVLQHSGSMRAGEQQLTISVVPDSGTGELAGLSGRMTIEIEGSEHRYLFDYNV
jgi:hypothetical protein